MRNSVDFDDITRLFPQFNEPRFTPDPSEPLPESMIVEWADESDQVKELLKSKTPEAVNQISELSGSSPHFIRFVIQTKWNVLLIVLGFAIVLGGSFVEYFIRKALYETPDPVPVIVGPTIGFILIAFGAIVNRFFSVNYSPARLLEAKGSEDILAQEYRERVQAWALKRYGRKVDHLARTHMDCVGRDNNWVSGEMPNRIYCYKQNDGWVMGDSKGTELPLAFATA